MDSFPMIARCKVAQWRGLDPDERELITWAWNVGQVNAAGMIGSPPDRTLAVYVADNGAALMSLKVD